MNFMETKHQIVKEMKKLGYPNPVALALVGSRVSGYSTQESDYDFNAIIEKKESFNYLNLMLGSDILSVKIQGIREFEKNMKSSKGNSENSRFVILPYQSLENKNYLEKIEGESREKMVKKFIKILPPKKSIKVNLKTIAEWPLIERSLQHPDYTERVRRIAKSPDKFYELIIPRYVKTLKNMGHFISSKGNFILENEEKQEFGLEGMLSVAKERYNLARRLELGINQYIKGGLIMGLEIPYYFYNFFNKNPEIKKVGTEYKYVGPSLKDFLNKRKIFIPLEDVLKNLKYSIIKELSKN
ncbi:hypothetical protein COU58_00520 [Candidatus Pacearchaeota archaeon CG10_big_fil_rev_8_21_14_0_10_32_42]|nr:MAG: hypothetical protein COU58_00520 [Candidatus Pacearchaeota archaeon CG10_big_fil_rev_8_21_14_0_10_32_42]